MGLNIGDKVLYGGVEYKVTQEIMGIYWGRKKHARQDVELPLSEVTPLKELKQFKRQNSTGLVLLSKEDRKQILAGLVEEKTLKENYIKELVLLNSMIKKFPNEEFWRDIFKPALKVESLTYWLNRQEVEDLYKRATIDLTSKVEVVKLEESKVGDDLVLEKRKPRNILELLK